MTYTARGLFESKGVKIRSKTQIEGWVRGQRIFNTLHQAETRKGGGGIVGV